eukprot:1313223-Amphidinium_carterae.2
MTIKCTVGHGKSNEELGITHLDLLTKSFGKRLRVWRTDLVNNLVHVGGMLPSHLETVDVQWDPELRNTCVCLWRAWVA